jgi:bis(5'-nucleosyl)-tetraphosphatase (symmetrical)
MRYCTVDGLVDLKVKAAPGHQPQGFLPWFDIPGRASREVRVICGHWSTLGFKRRDDLLAIDTGCVWGGSLTAVNLDANQAPILLACNGHLEPGGGEDG